MQSLYSIEFHVFRWQLRYKIWCSFKDGVYDYLQCILRLLSEGGYYKDLTINQSLITAYTLQSNIRFLAKVKNLPKNEQNILVKICSLLKVV